MNETTKLHKRDTTSSYDEFLRYVQPYKLIPTTSTTHPVNNETPNLYFEGATLSIFIYEGRPTTTKLTLVDLPSSINHSTFHECSKGILCLAPTFHHSPLTRPVVIISYSLRLGRKNTLLSTSTTCWKTERESFGGIPVVAIVTSRTRSLRDPTQQDFIHARTLPIYMCHTRFKF